MLKEQFVIFAVVKEGIFGACFTTDEDQTIVESRATEMYLFDLSF